MHSADRMQLAATGEIFAETRERGLDAYFDHMHLPKELRETAGVRRP